MMPVGELPSAPPRVREAGRPIRIVQFCPWADRLRPAADFLRELSAGELAARVRDPADEDLMRMAALDRDWHGETVRAFAALGRENEHLTAVPEGMDFLPSWVFGVVGAAELISRANAPEEERWLVITGQHPQLFGGAAGRFFQGCARRGFRILYYAFDEASRTMPCFPEIAPHLDVLIHDERPLAEPGRSRLRPDCQTVHRSWVANLIPFAAPFIENPEPKIVFLGSKLGLT
ncbi:MAG: hypothetical protein ACREFX_12930, partial [Opitutaceae bacterium]